MLEVLVSYERARGFFTFFLTLSSEESQNLWSRGTKQRFWDVEVLGNCLQLAQNTIILLSNHEQNTNPSFCSVERDWVFDSEAKRRSIKSKAKEIVKEWISSTWHHVTGSQKE